VRLKFPGISRARSRRDRGLTNHSTVVSRTAEKVEQLNDSSGKDARLCGISDANTTYKEMTEYGSNAFLKGTSLQMKVFLFSLSQCIKKSGVTEVALEDVSRAPAPQVRVATHPLIDRRTLCLSLSLSSTRS
jgi:hypothetical protein